MVVAKNVAVFNSAVDKNGVGPVPRYCVHSPKARLLYGYGCSVHRAALRNYSAFFIAPLFEQILGGIEVIISYLGKLYVNMFTYFKRRCDTSINEVYIHENWLSWRNTVVSDRR